MKKYIAVLTLMFLPLLAGCNTMEGLGQDVQKGGEKIEETAEDNKQ
jgi:predicted small secreted protein